MNSILVCSVLFLNGFAADWNTEVCYVAETHQTVNAYCQFISGFAYGANRQVTFCSLARGRTKPDPMTFTLKGVTA